jgi:predicted phage terminase large subunit-like protein
MGETFHRGRFTQEQIERKRRNTSAYAWASLYQQRPTAKEGSFFKVAKLIIEDARPAEVVSRVRYWDKAATEGAGDYTVGALLSLTSDGLYFVEDIVRGQWDTSERDRVIRQTAALDGTLVPVVGEEEGGSGGVDAAKAFVKMLAGYVVSTRRVSGQGNKETRADPFSAQVNAGNVRLITGAWNKAFIEELRSFPQGKHDDQVDASSGAFNELSSLINWNSW